MDLTVLGNQGFADSTNSSDKNGTLNKGYLQGVKVETLKSLFDSGNAKSVYKLVLNSVFEKETKIDLENQGVRGALGLVKATYGKEDNKGGAEKIEINDTNKVGLIIASGVKATYLMPVVRVSGGGGGDGQCKSDEKKKDAETEINKSGVADITEGTKKFDNGNEWEDYQSERIKQAMSRDGEQGFSITRKAETAIVSGKGQGFEWRGTENENGLKKEYLKGRKDVEFLYKNAGELVVKGGWKDDSHYCYRKERYFPLDLVILNKQDEEKGEEENKITVDNKGTITITDKIEQIIRVRN